jgi:hypothetical protein
VSLLVIRTSKQWPEWSGSTDCSEEDEEVISAKLKASLSSDPKRESIPNPSNSISGYFDFKVTMKMRMFKRRIQTMLVMTLMIQLNPKKKAQRKRHRRRSPQQFHKDVSLKVEE